MTTSTKQRLMRETVIVEFSNGVFGTNNTVFDIEIPEGYAIEIHEVNFLIACGVNPVNNNCTFILCDDPDETANPGHAAEKVIQSTGLHVSPVATGSDMLWLIEKLDCFRTLTVVKPNFVSALDNDPLASFNAYCRIWFDFIKITEKDILRILRQQQY